MKSLTRTFSTAGRVLAQIKNDPRTVVLILVVPSLLIGLLSWTFNNEIISNQVGPSMLGLFPFTIMFVITSITTLVERRSGTLERFLTFPLRRQEFIFGYAIAFGLLATLQALVTLSFCIWVVGMEIAGDTWLLAIVAIINGLLGMALGLMASAFAKTEFQVMQLMPAFIFPQMLIGGIIVPFAQMPDVLQAIADVLPLTHAVRALNELATSSGTADVVWQEIAIVALFALGGLVLGAITLRRKTP
jgi:ABC-2 type transport system permease protein